MKFVSAGKQKHGFFVDLEDGTGKKIWMNCADSPEHKTTEAQLYNWAKKIKTDTLVEVEYTKDDKNNYYATRINLVKEVVNNQPTPEAKFQNVKVEKNFLYPDRYQYPKTPEESEQIKKLAIAHSVTTVVKGILVNQQGSIDRNQLSEFIKTAFVIVTEEVKKLTD